MSRTEQFNAVGVFAGPAGWSGHGVAGGVARVGEHALLRLAFQHTASDADARTVVQHEDFVGAGGFGVGCHRRHGDTGQDTKGAVRLAIGAGGVRGGCPRFRRGVRVHVGAVVVASLAGGVLAGGAAVDVQTSRRLGLQTLQVVPDCHGGHGFRVVQRQNTATQAFARAVVEHHCFPHHVHQRMPHPNVKRSFRHATTVRRAPGL